MGLQHLETFDPEAWGRARLQAKKTRIKATPAPIVVSDIGFAAPRRPTSGQSGVEGLGLFVGVIRASH